MLAVEGGMRSALDVSGAHPSYLASNEKQSASSAQLGPLVPAPEIPLDGREEEASGGTNKEADYI